VKMIFAKMLTIIAGSGILIAKIVNIFANREISSLDYSDNRK